MALTKVGPYHVDRLMALKQSAGLSARTCNHIRAVLRNALHDAMGLPRYDGRPSMGRSAGGCSTDGASDAAETTEEGVHSRLE